METRQPTLGGTLRGARYGYRWVAALGAYMAVTPFDVSCVEIPDNGFEVLICPAGMFPKNVSRRPHLCWWEGPQDTRGELVGYVLAAIAGGADRVNVKRPVTIRFDEHGKVVT